MRWEEGEGELTSVDDLDRDGRPHDAWSVGGIVWGEHDVTIERTVKNASLCSLPSCANASLVEHC